MNQSKKRVIRSIYFPLADETYTYLFVFLAESVKHDGLPLVFFRFTFSILSRLESTSSTHAQTKGHGRANVNLREYTLEDETYTYLLS